MRSLLALIPLVSALAAAAPGVSEQFYNAIRNDDTEAVAAMIARGSDVNTRDSRGTTPLMYAAAAGSPAMMRKLIAAGADPNARDSFDATALMWCANSLEKVTLLTAAGADVNAASKQGRTPLLIAAAHDGNIEVVRHLLAKGANHQVKDVMGTTPLIEAARANSTAVIRLLLDRGADVNEANAVGFTPLILTAGFGNAAVLKELLAAGANPNARTADSYEQPVKKGKLALGYMTPLLLAVNSHSPETVRLLLEAGADVNAKDVRGMTPLMLAVATDHPNGTIIKMLLAKNPATGVKSSANETALAWAAKFQERTVVGAIHTASPGVTVPKPYVPQFTLANTRRPEQAVEKSLALLQRTTTSLFKEGGCASCHSHNITAAAAALARAKGIRYDRDAAMETVRATRLQFAAPAGFMLQRLDPPAVEILTYAMFGLAVDGAEPDRTTDAMVHNIAAQQLSDGSWWSHPGMVRPPTADGRFSVTAMAIRALRDFAPPARRAEMHDRIARAAAWLAESEPWTTEDTAMQLLGATWAGMDRAAISKFARRVLALQRPDGGWGQTPNLRSDAYATGTALYALQEAGAVTHSHPASKKAVTYLLRTQASDGSWYVASRAPKFQPYFESGFPYHHDQWISQFATGWASMALSGAIPETRAAR